MQLVLPNGEDINGSDQDRSRWALLPRLCCQAAGGDPDLTDEISAAWLLLYLATHLVDSVEDEDYSAQVDVLGGIGPAINVANGLFLSAALLLNQLHGSIHTREMAVKISTDFFNTILVMTSGQHQDLVIDMMTLDQWWQVAEAKAGAFFSLACRSGAQLAVDDPQVIIGYSDFGLQLGVMLQIHDDFEDLRDIVASEHISASLNLKRSLAAAYALTVLPDAEKTRLSMWIESSPYEPEIIRNIIEIMDDCGAGLYMATKLKHHNDLASKSLGAVNPRSPAREKLFELLSQLNPI
jgi:geranylgeranyl pyrophosphate synthase